MYVLTRQDTGHNGLFVMKRGAVPC
jgi:hypothetical protein